jgi:hypothetical protein
MTNLSNLVHENHDISFKNLRSVGKISDIAETEDCHNLLPRNHDINDAWIFDNSGNNFRACLAKSDSEERTDFNNHILQ